MREKGLILFRGILGIEEPASTFDVTEGGGRKGKEVDRPRVPNT